MIQDQCLHLLPRANRAELLEQRASDPFDHFHHQRRCLIAETGKQQYHRTSPVPLKNQSTFSNTTALHVDVDSDRLKSSTKT